VPNSCFSDYHSLANYPRLVLLPIIALALDMYLTSLLLTSNSVNNFDYMETDGRGVGLPLARAKTTVRSKGKRKGTRMEISSY
jgi:hypothetical protein